VTLDLGYLLGLPQEERRSLELFRKDDDEGCLVEIIGNPGRLLSCCLLALSFDLASSTGTEPASTGKNESGARLVASLNRQKRIWSQACSQPERVKKRIRSGLEGRPQTEILMVRLIIHYSSAQCDRPLPPSSQTPGRRSTSKHPLLYLWLLFSQLWWPCHRYNAKF
jgi:hypothetical protein